MANANLNTIALTDARIQAIKAPAQGRDEHKDAGPGYVQGLRLRVGTSGQKVWVLRARIASGPINKKLGTYPALGLADARTQASKVLQALARSGNTEALERTFAACASAWMEHVSEPNNRSSNRQQAMLDQHVLPALGSLKITELRRAHVFDLLAAIPGKVLPNRLFSIIKTIMRYALKRDWVEFSPLEGIDRPLQEKPRSRTLAMTEAAAVWKAAEQLDQRSQTFVQVLMLTAQRRNEVAGMQWDELDLDAARWAIPAERMKNGKPHLVRLSAQVVAILRAMPRKADAKHVFAGRVDAPFNNCSYIKPQIDAAMAEAGLSMEGWRWHDLRRTAATHMPRLGVTELVVGRVLSHTPQTVTGKVYSLYSYEAEKLSALSLWADELARAVEPQPDNVIRLAA